MLGKKVKPKKALKIFFVIIIVWTCIFMIFSIERYISIVDIENGVAERVFLDSVSSKNNNQKDQLLCSLVKKICFNFPVVNVVFSDKKQKINIKKFAYNQKISTENGKNILDLSNKNQYDEKIKLIDKNCIKVNANNTVMTKVNVDSKEKLESNESLIRRLIKTKSRLFLLKKFYITDSSTSINPKLFNVNNLLSADLKIKKEKAPQILIVHTHGASESFVGSRKGVKEDSVIGVGDLLGKILSKEYGYNVIHDRTEYDKINGQIDRSRAYNYALSGVKRTLKKYPSIKVIIDLHRDGVGKKVNRTTVIDGKRTAQVMFFNGLSRNSRGDIPYLKNDKLFQNLAFSLQLKIACMNKFKNFSKPIYLKNYRYNMHLRERYTLIELGNENNTLTEAKNAMAPLAMAINTVLSGK